jgi:RNA polymerase sigma factor (TIGR02999 family)
MDRLFDETYKELLRLAKQVKRNDAHATISTSTLVHEAWLKLVTSSALALDSEAHFRGLAACAMRHIVIDAAKRRHAFKRGGMARFITIDDALAAPIERDEDLLRLSSALDNLANLSPRQARLVELRFFGGFKVAEIAVSLGISEKTAERDWSAARAWLAAEIRRNKDRVQDIPGASEG